MSSFATENRFMNTVLAVDPAIDGEIIHTMAAELQIRYSEPQRYYHTLEHISYMLKALESSGRSSEMLELAIWFHDCVYDPVKGGPSNELESIRVFETFVDTTKSRAMAALRVSVSTLIEATIQHRVPDVLPAQLCASDVTVFLDLDMSILAETPEVYDKYSQQIRWEYAHVLAKDYGSMDGQAKENILREIRRLEMTSDADI
ncbi:hypothetical protein R3P38DRAFT_2858723 [Favolaschia claudopus]|uniref:Uncharacterized protein n=1 Tax=Favolaschia claudopus TaxID=2862362 RepID=A0AAW0DIB5_9AGAR